MADRKIIVNAATSADGFIARPDGDIDWLTSRPKPAGFYDMGKFTATVDAKILGRKTYEKSLELGAKFGGRDTTYVCSSNPRLLRDPPAWNLSLSRSLRLRNDCAIQQARTSG
jgi:dihydrofolate reductase